ncbi:MAG: FAD-dependent oxidoreductase [Thermomicrobiales bacterium]
MDYGKYSFWLETCGDDLTPRPALEGTQTVDVAILGAGYTGLWTAYYLLQQQPSLRVAVVEGEIAGFGASGRNGGWCYAGFPLSLGALAERFGREQARATLLAMCETVAEVARVCEAEGIDAQIAASGVLRIARGPEQLPALGRAMRTYEEYGLAEYYQLLSQEELAARIRVSRALGAIWGKVGLTVQPARLVRGLARAVERRGGTIYEQSRVTEFHGGERPRLVTERGEVRAQAIVLAGEAYLTRFAAFRSQLLPLYSLIRSPSRCRMRNGRRSAGRDASASRPTGTSWTTCSAPPTGGSCSAVVGHPIAMARRFATNTTGTGRRTSGSSG